MKIAICDFRFHKGHRTFNGAVLEVVASLTENNFIYFDNGDNYRNSDKYVKNRYLIKNRNFKKNNPLQNRLNSKKYMKEEFKILKEEKVDKIICVAYDLLTFGLFGKRYLKKDIYLWHHAESDELNNKLKNKIFRRYMNKVKHIVYTPFIKDFLISFGIEPNRIFVCPFVKTSTQCIESVPEKNFYIAPSGSNDEEFCKTIVDYEKRTSFFVNNKIRLFIKSYETVYDDGYLSLYNRYLSFDEYDELYKKALAVVLPFPKSFNMRESGTIIDALASGKRVIASNIPTVRYYQNICSKIDSNAVSIYDNIEEFCNLLIKNINSDNINNYAFSKLIDKMHNTQALFTALKDILL